MCSPSSRLTSSATRSWRGTTRYAASRHLLAPPASFACLICLLAAACLICLLAAACLIQHATFFPVPPVAPHPACCLGQQLVARALPANLVRVADSKGDDAACACYRRLSLTKPVSAPRTPCQYMRRKARGLTGAQISRCACPSGTWLLVRSLLCPWSLRRVQGGWA